MVIRLIAQLSVPAANREKFSAAVAKAVESVRKNEPGTLEFEFHAGEDGLTFLVQEAYKDAQAYVAHRQNMASTAAGVMNYCTPNWAAITGPLPPDVVATVQPKDGAPVYFATRFAGL